jgi:serine/threonine protein kinase
MLKVNIKFYGGQVGLMFEYLHSKNIVYRDLKEPTIGADGFLKLTDFGFAREEHIHYVVLQSIWRQKYC